MPDTVTTTARSQPEWGTPLSSPSPPAKRLSFNHRPSSGCFADPLRTGFPCSSSASKEKLFFPGVKDASVDRWVIMTPPPADKGGRLEQPQNNALRA
jgi:hypothetical protein